MEDGKEPPWRCEGCVKDDKYAINHVLDLVRNDKGNFCLVMEYLGNPYYEVSLPTEVDEVHQEHVTAYRAQWSNAQVRACSTPWVHSLRQLSRVTHWNN